MLYDAYQKSIRFLLDKNTYRRLGSSITSFFLRAAEYRKNIEKKIPNWNIREKAHPAVIRYGIVVVLIFFAVLFKHAVNSISIYELPFMIFYSVIVVSTWYGGLRPGMLAVLLSAFFARVYFFPPFGEHDSLSIFLGLLLFILEGLLIVALSHSMHYALQKLEERKRYFQYFASIAKHISDAVISTDMHFVIQSWNRAAESLYEWKKNEVLGRPLRDIIPSALHSLTQADLMDILAQEGYWRGEVTQEQKGGGLAYVLTSISMIRDDDGKPLGVVAVNRDITDRKKLEQGKDDFIALASHELKTPLTSIQLYADVLRQRFDKTGDRKSMAYLTKIDVQMKKFLELVNHLLDMSKVQAGKLHYTMEEVLIDTFVSHVVRDVQEVTDTHRIIIKDRVRVMVRIDKDRLQQVLVNILNNAVKYSAKADKIIVSMRQEGGYVIVSVQDFGLGIPKEKHDKIFERFYQVTDAKGYTYSGMGLGLYISREIIEKHNGKIWVESEEGKGSTFYLSLPIAHKEHNG